MMLFQLVNAFLIAFVIVASAQAMTITLYGGSRDGVKTFDIDAVTQRCYNIYNCFGGPNKSATWTGVKGNTNVVFYSNRDCQTHQAVGKGTPDGALYFSDVNFPQNVYAFMIWETGQYATNGVVDACYMDERSIINTTDTAISP